MLKLVAQRQFERDAKQVHKRGKQLEDLHALVTLLLNEKPLPPKNKNHSLKGEFSDCFECHIESNWLLIYKKTKTEIILVRTGTHSDLF
jgi:mRNA interferase YafQ